MKFALYAAVVTFAATLSAQNPLTTETKTLHDGVRNNILKAAEKMPEEEYAFKPTPDVRSFAQLIGHVADAQYLFCAPVKEEKKGPPGIEKSKTANAAMDDAKVVAPIKFFGRERSKLAVLNFNSSHNNEHYGNIVTYMRLKGLVPPSSERR